MRALPGIRRTMQTRRKFLAATGTTLAELAAGNDRTLAGVGASFQRASSSGKSASHLVSPTRKKGHKSEKFQAGNAAGHGDMTLELPRAAVIWKGRALGPENSGQLVFPRILALAFFA